MPLAVRVVLTAAAVSALGTGLVLPFTVVYLHRFLGISLPEAGLVVGAASLAGLLTGPMWGSLIDRWSPQRVLVIGALGQGAALVLFTMAGSMTTACLALALLGATQSSAYPSQSSLFSVLTTGKTRSRVFGLSFTFANLGVCVGGLVSGVMVTHGGRDTFDLLYRLDAATFVLLAAAVHFAVPRSPRAVPSSSGEDKGSYRAALALPVYRRIFVISFLLAFAGQGAFEFGMPTLVLSDSSIPISAVAYVFAVNTAVIVLVQPLVLRRIVEMRRVTVFRLVALLWASAAAVFAVIGLVPGSYFAVGLLCVYGAVVALGEILVAPHLGPLTNDVTPAHLRGRFNVALSISFSAAFVLSPVVSTFLLDAGLGWCYAVILAAGCGYVARGSRVLISLAADRAAQEQTIEENRGVTHA
ncbi:MFS transporter [Actinokineospora sp.]|uniref:MFS transporter n=1 Tax=Actinokineospora sp. TaxID=1872133 RepID=UPI003D6AF93B